MQTDTKDGLDGFYSKPDPFQYQNNPEDIKRKQIILSKLDKKFKRALDLGGGEGWISKDLPAEIIEVYEISDKAKSRLPGGVLGVTEPTGEYDLIIATGVMYKQYNPELFLNIIKKHATGTVLLCNIKDWLVDVSILGTPKLVEEFPYRQYTQKLMIYEKL